MPNTLPAAPEVSHLPQIAGGVNPEYLDFALEMIGLGTADLKTPVMQRIAQVWRGAGSWEQRTLATMEAANTESPGLWRAITSAPSERIAVQEMWYAQHVEETRQEIAECTSPRIAAGRENQMAEQHHAHCRGHGHFKRWTPKT